MISGGTEKAAETGNQIKTSCQSSNDGWIALRTVLEPRLAVSPGTSLFVSLNSGESNEIELYHSDDRLLRTDGLGDEDLCSTDNVSVVSSVDPPTTDNQVTLYDQRVALDNLRQSRATFSNNSRDESGNEKISDLKRRYADICKDPKIKKAIKKLN